eukprot:m.249267 g.249267  ORF g.249267 m.249267 type:complete len:63 (+) comp19087_c3_seq1:692-880(+)
MWVLTLYFCACGNNITLFSLGGCAERGVMSECVSPPKHSPSSVTLPTTATAKQQSRTPQEKK